jgi:putative hydrolase of the HAD superfamily
MSTSPVARVAPRSLPGSRNCWSLRGGITASTSSPTVGLAPYIDVLLTSEQAGAGKPDPRIFHLALRKAGAAVEDSLMIGDSAGNDMAGARRVGMDHAHYTAEDAPDPLATVRFGHFDELVALLR